MTLNRTPERGHLSLAVIPRRLGGLLSRHFSCLLAPRDRTRISASAACGEAREWVKQANRPADERQLRWHCQLNLGEQHESAGGCAITRPRRHTAIGSPPRLGRSAASSARRDGVED